MKKDTKRITLLAVAFAVAMLAPACANKTAPVVAAQVSHDALATAQDIEAQLCWGVATAALAPADRTHCTSSVATTIKLTDALHQQINAKLATAFEMHQSATAAIKLGTTIDTSSLNALLADILKLIAQLQQTATVQQLASQVQAGEIK